MKRPQGRLDQFCDQLSQLAQKYPEHAQTLNGTVQQLKAHSAKVRETELRDNMTRPW